MGGRVPYGYRKEPYMLNGKQTSRYVVVPEEAEIVKLIYSLYAQPQTSFGDIVKQSAEKYEPYIIARYLISLAQAFSSFYNDNKIIVEDKKVQDARLYLTYAVNTVLKLEQSY